MKKLVFLLSVVGLTIIVGCKEDKTEVKINANEFEFIDTLIRKSEENFVTVTRANQKSDSSINKKVEKTVQQITSLKEEVKQLKQENNELKAKINDINDVGQPFRLLPVSNGKDNR
jgi:peptidoglycan hydrolase CwlO-like protein